MVQRTITSTDFSGFFSEAMGHPPFPFQRDFAEALPLPQLVRVPTGLGKTAMVVVGWLWRRFDGNEEQRSATPRRLVYCLPMRVLVEQTAKNASAWIQALRAKDRLPADVPVHVLMGGEDEDDWDLHPERDAILIGTQDMLLSRALNRGYAASRSRWPLQFGLLHTDCLWVFDEIQLMGSGLATTAQMEAFRKLLPFPESQLAKDNHGCRSVWMSATMQKDWLGTVDFKPFLKEAPELAFEYEQEIKKPGLDKGVRATLKNRWTAEKPLEKTAATMGEPSKLAAEILGKHREACHDAGNGTRTIAVVNTVRRACELYESLRDEIGGDSKKRRKSKKKSAREGDSATPAALGPRMVLLHSRFRPGDRKQRVEEALAVPGENGTIVVSTQVIEAGVDVSATTMFTELAPWASLVQRFGRCNRTGDDKGARVFWVDLPGKAGDAATTAPYKEADVAAAKKQLADLKKKDVGLGSLPPVELPFDHVHVIRRRDLVDLFDTTPDLAGNDIDIDRFVREVDESDVRVFWRAWDQPKGYEPPPDDESAPRREELCPAPIGSDKNSGFKQFARNHGGKVWRWSFLDKKWERCDQAGIAPGQLFLVHGGAGGYSPERGWEQESVDPVKPLGVMEKAAQEANDDDLLGVWQTIERHTDEVASKLDGIVKALSITGPVAEALGHAVRWHDRGKAHAVFQAALPDSAPEAVNIWAKADGSWRRYSRKHFRHELVSALSVLDPRNNLVPNDLRNLVAYLVAAHHGKVRLSIRSLPGEAPRPDGGRRFARGVWDGDELHETVLGAGVSAPAATLSLEPMEMGLCEQPPYAGLPSWAERMLTLRDALGPFRLAYLEAILRAADMRASRKAKGPAT